MVTQAYPIFQAGWNLNNHQRFQAETCDMEMHRCERHTNVVGFQKQMSSSRKEQRHSRQEGRLGLNPLGWVRFGEIERAVDFLRRCWLC